MTQLPATYFTFANLQMAAEALFGVFPGDQPARAIASSCHSPERLSAKLIQGGRQHSLGLDAAFA